jgi:predicted DNA-binding transcriptional regulator YafY
MNYQETLYRLNTLLDCLQQYKEVGIDELLAFLEVPRTTLTRDIERLQNMGHEIEYCRKKRAYILIG